MNRVAVATLVCSFATAGATLAGPEVDRAIQDALQKYPAGDYPDMRTRAMPDSSITAESTSGMVGKARAFIRRTNPTFDWSKYHVTVRGPALGEEKNGESDHVVVIRERNDDGSAGRTIAEVQFDSLGMEVKKIQWFNVPETR